MSLNETKKLIMISTMKMVSRHSVVKRTWWYTFSYSFAMKPNAMKYKFTTRLGIQSTPVMTLKTARYLLSYLIMYLGPSAFFTLTIVSFAFSYSPSTASS